MCALLSSSTEWVKRKLSRKRRNKYKGSIISHWMRMHKHMHAHLCTRSANTRSAIATTYWARVCVKRTILLTNGYQFHYYYKNCMHNVCYLRTVAVTVAASTIITHKNTMSISGKSKKWSSHRHRNTGGPYLIYKVFKLKRISMEWRWREQQQQQQENLNTRRTKTKL